MLMLQSIQLPDLLNVTCSSEIMICCCFMAEYYLFLAFLRCTHSEIEILCKIYRSFYFIIGLIANRKLLKCKLETELS